MALGNTNSSFGSLSKFFHWLMFALIAFNFSSGWTMADMPKGDFKNLTYLLHKSTGVTVLTLVLARLIWRWMNVQPDLPPTLSPAERMGARTSHWLLYALMFAVPISGYVLISAGGFGFDWYGLFRVPELIGKNEEISDLASAAHYWLTWAFIAMIALHFAAALRHHFQLKDDTLRRMLPGGR